MTAEPIRTERLTLRETQEGDLPALIAALREPDVARWWPGFDEEEARMAFLGRDDITVLTIEHRGQVIGAIQFYEHADPGYRHAGADLFVASAWQGKGLGSEAVRGVAGHLFDARGHHRMVIDPAATNLRAIRAYEKVGFRQVGVMRQYERGADGTWHDCVMMELLKGDLR
ncbi:MAG TPA: GNAT family protein [Myxococcaceae bacterium]|nr:GNAT family protein [Myxococcaceae bacterium]